MGPTLTGLSRIRITRLTPFWVRYAYCSNHMISYMMYFHSGTTVTLPPKSSPHLWQQLLQIPRPLRQSPRFLMPFTLSPFPPCACHPAPLLHPRCCSVSLSSNQYVPRSIGATSPQSGNRHLSSSDTITNFQLGCKRNQSFYHASSSTIIQHLIFILRNII